MLLARWTFVALFFYRVVSPRSFFLCASILEELRSVICLRVCVSVCLSVCVFDLDFEKCCALLVLLCFVFLRVFFASFFSCSAFPHSISDVYVNPLEANIFFKLSRQQFKHTGDSVISTLINLFLLFLKKHFFSTTLGVFYWFFSGILWKKKHKF